MPKCIICEVREAVDMHEIFSDGTKHTRDTQIRYKIQAPVCRICHDKCKGRFQKQNEYREDYKHYYQKLICDKMDLNWQKLHDIFRTSQWYQIKKNRIYLRRVKLKLEVENEKV